MANLYRQAYTTEDPETGKRTKHRSKKWYGQYRDADGVVQRVPLSTDKSAAQSMLSDLVRRVERQRGGLIDAAADRLAEPISEHLAEYKRHLEAKGRAEFHISETARLITKVTEECRLRVLKDLQADGERIEEHLANRLAAGSSHRTVNADLTAIRSFCRWLIHRKRLPADPTIGIAKLNEEDDRRRERRALTDEEAQLLIETTRHSPRVFRSLSGADRAVMYTLAQRTGLRRSELRSLQPVSFDLTGTPPIVRVKAGHSKHRKTDTLPLSRDLVELLKKYLVDRPAKKPVWPGSWWRRSAEMLYADLRDAGIEPVADDGSVVDFHGQRVTFITELARTGSSPAAVQKLARHSDYNLTLRTYTRLGIDELVSAVEKLPPLGGNTGNQDTNTPQAQATPTMPDMPNDPRLRDVVVAWPSLPDQIKNAIAMLIAPPTTASK